MFKMVEVCSNKRLKKIFRTNSESFLLNRVQIENSSLRTKRASFTTQIALPILWRLRIYTGYRTCPDISSSICTAQPYWRQKLYVSDVFLELEIFSYVSMKRKFIFQYFSRPLYSLITDYIIVYWLYITCGCIQ